MVVKHNTACFRARKKDITFKYLKHLKKHTVVFFFSHKEIKTFLAIYLSSSMSSREDVGESVLRLLERSTYCNNIIGTSYHIIIRMQEEA